MMMLTIPMILVNQNDELLHPSNQIQGYPERYPLESLNTGININSNKVCNPDLYMQ